MSYALRSQAALSSAVHAFPSLLEKVARKTTGLTLPLDLLLRWRAGTPPPDYQVTDNPSWVHLDGFPGADPHRPETWRNVSIAVGTRALEGAVLQGAKPAVAYHPSSSDQWMFGVNEMQRRVEMLTRLHVGDAETGGNAYAVNVREGADPISFAIGYVLAGNFLALPTVKVEPEALPTDAMLFCV